MVDVLKPAFQELCQWLSWVPDPPLQPLRTSRLPQCPSPGSMTVPKLPYAMLKRLCHVLSSPAQPRVSPQGTLLAVLLPGGQKLILVLALLHPPAPGLNIFSWQHKYIHDRNCSITKLELTIPTTMPFATAFLLVFRYTLLYTHIWGKKNRIQGQNFLKQKEFIPACSSPKRHTTHFAILSAPCHFVSSTDS